MAILTQESKVFDDSREFSIYKLFNDQQATATSTALDAREASGISLIVETNASVSNGTILLEGAVSSDAYAGAWVQLGSITTNAASTTFKATYDNLAGPVPYIRARVSSGLTGGSADVYVVLNK